MKKMIKNIIKKLEIIYYQAVIHHCEIKKIHKKKKLWESVKLTGLQREEIKKAFGGGIGRQYRWHRYYQYFTGNFDAKYFPEILFSTKLEPILNNRKVADVLQDKSLLRTLYGSVEGIYIPKTIVLNSYGKFIDTYDNLLTYEQARDIVKGYLEKNKKAIIKPTVGSCSGQNVKMLNSIKDWDNTYKENYVIQEVITNQEDIKKLNPDSLNTMRVMTYICNNKYYCAPIVLRMGRGKSHLDNAHAGGIFIGVKDNGELFPEAYSEYGDKFKLHPYTKVKFEGYKLKGIDKVIDIAIKLHKKTPQLGMISWDITINEKGIPTLIEANMFGQAVWIGQISHGKSFFGENTNRMLSLLK